MGSLSGVIESREESESLFLGDDHFNHDKVDENNSSIYSEDFLPSFLYQFRSTFYLLPMSDVLIDNEKITQTQCSLQ